MEDWEHARRCFVLKPFSVRDEDLPKYGDRNHWTEVYGGLIRPAVEGCGGLVCERDDIDVGSRAIVEGIFTKIEHADLVLCDVSGFNPNVLFELGWTFRSDKPYVLIKDDATTFPFDLSQQYMFTYGHRLQPSTLRRDTEALSRVVVSTLNDTDRRYSVVRRLEFSMRALDAANAGNAEASLLLEIRQSLQSLNAREGPSPAARETQLPVATRRANALLEAALRLLTAKGIDDRAQLAMELHDQARLMGTAAQEDIQLTVEDQDGVIVYHDRTQLIGSGLLAVTHMGEVFSEVLSYASGATAWCDSNRNVPGNVPWKRLNLAIFATAPSGLKAIVEVHVAQ